jgi:hypothetical protein
LAMLMLVLSWQESVQDFAYYKQYKQDNLNQISPIPDE